MNNLISIIIPTFNRAHTITNAIESVQDQWDKNWELIIVDDGSTDATKKVISKYLSDKRIQYFFQEKSGVSEARNKGVDVCRGDYIIFLDSDDRLLSGLFSKLNEIVYTNYDLICWQVSKLMDGESIVLNPEKLEKIYNNITASFLAGSICYKKKIFLDAGGYDAKMSFGENYELGMRISEINDLKIKNLDQQFLFYEINNQNRESNSLSNRLNSYLYLYHKHKTKYENDKKSHSQIKYLLGFVYEKLELNSEAKNFYQSSFLINPLNFKALLKSLYFKLK